MHTLERIIYVLVCVCVWIVQSTRILGYCSVIPRNLHLYPLVSPISLCGRLIYVLVCVNCTKYWTKMKLCRGSLIVRWYRGIFTCIPWRPRYRYAIGLPGFLARSQTFFHFLLFAFFVKTSGAPPVVVFRTFLVYTRVRGQRSGRLDLKIQMLRLGCGI